MDCQTMLKIIDELNEQYISVWEKLCLLESPTASKPHVDAAGAYLIELAKVHGWQVEVLELEHAGNAFVVRMNPESTAAPVTFSGHIDTVHPVGSFAEPVVWRDDTYIYGPGTADCKGGVVAAFMAMDALERCGFKKRPVQLIVQTDEETGSKTSGKKTVEFMCEKAKGSAAFLNGEGIKGNEVSLSRKGILRYRFTVHGMAAHSARCTEGANAVAEAAHKILQLEKLKDDEGLTCNCGVIQGGTVANAVAAECMFLADIRFATYEQRLQAQQIVQAIAEHTEIAGCTCTLEQVSDRPPMPWEERNIALLEKLNAIYQANGLPELKAKFSYGGSDAAYVTEAGIPCIDDMGVQGERIHSTSERALLASLAESARRFAAAAWGL